MRFLALTITLLPIISAQIAKDLSDKQLLVITVATELTDGFVRFNRSATIYGHKLEVLGLNQQWKGGDVTKYPGGGHKVNLLKLAVEKLKDNDSLVVLFVDSYDVVLTSGPEEILKRFIESGAKVLFSSEGFCWPDKTLESEYPTTEGDGNKFLNSGAFIGYAPQIYQIVSSSEVMDLYDDQLFYTKIYIDETLRNKFEIKLDHRSNIFQNLNGATGDVEIRFSDDDAYIHNTAYQTNPIVIHGNGQSKVVLNSLGNYLAKSWHPKRGCLSCNENKMNLKKLKSKEMPIVLVGIFITHGTPFMAEFFDTISQLKYNKKRMNLFIFNSVAYHEKVVQEFIDKRKTDYKGVTVYSSDAEEWKARNAALDECVKVNCDYYLSIDSDARLTNPNTLIKLIEQNKGVVAPLLARYGQLWSNFWGALTAEGYYSRSHDYVDIVEDKRRGVWNVPFISQSYLINGSLLKLNSIDANMSPSFYSTHYSLLDTDMIFCNILRDNGIFMYVMNDDEYGHLVNSDTFDTSKLHPDLYEIYSNQIDWQQKYIHKNYTQMLSADTIIEQPCPDVYWFPVLNPTFCAQLIEILENFGEWSSGSNYDSRLTGGYENVPTRDIHMNQIGFEQHWLYFLREYIRPVQEKAFTGYYNDPPKATMNFVVRYHPSEQPYLRPHHDSSTYTINIALNIRNVDYEGGGCRFIRYNCSVVDLRQGWALMHPGRLTHFHEGLHVTKGTRYIMVSFVDP